MFDCAATEVTGDLERQALPAFLADPGWRAKLKAARDEEDEAEAAAAEKARGPGR